MATYFPSSSNQRDATPMLYLRENFPTSYSESPVLPGNMMMYVNYSSSSGSYSDTLASNSHHQNNCIQPQQEILSNLGESRIGEEHDLNSWRDSRNEALLFHSMGGGGGGGSGGQGLSLSLQVPPSIQYRNPNPGFSSFLSPNSSISGEGNGRNESFRDDENCQTKQSTNTEYMMLGFSNPDQMKPEVTSYGMSMFARAVPNSRYLKAAQELLDEVVNVQKALKEKDFKKELMKDSKEVDEGIRNGTSSNPDESTSNSPNEISAAEKQDLQNKLSKLLSMLDEVDRRYKQYYHQMQIVVSSFDVIAGCGAAKPYTSLALKTISRHFRCLRDAINNQIRVTRRSLGEQDASANSKGVGISRLRYVDQQLRQQRTLQQLGVMQQHAWRPQRGLPESSVSILRAWLFEHFLHPYPKDSDKIILARQTGLTRSQVSNWFINARVRLWKPMVEEMYKEEIGDAEMDSNSSSDIASKATKEDAKAFKDRGEDFQQTATSTATEGQLFESESDHVTDIDMVGPSGDSSFPDTIIQSNGGSVRFMPAPAAYHMSEFGRFGNGSGVSLTLGLQHCEGGSLPMSVENHHGFVNMRGDDVYNAAAAASSIGAEAEDFDCMDSGNRQHRFGSSHMLHDFVA